MSASTTRALDAFISCKSSSTPSISTHSLFRDPDLLKSSICNSHLSSFRPLALALPLVCLPREQHQISSIELDTNRIYSSSRCHRPCRPRRINERLPSFLPQQHQGCSRRYGPIPIRAQQPHRHTIHLRRTMPADRRKLQRYRHLLRLHARISQLNHHPNIHRHGQEHHPNVAVLLARKALPERNDHGYQREVSPTPAFPNFFQSRRREKQSSKVTQLTSQPAPPQTPHAHSPPTPPSPQNPPSTSQVPPSQAAPPTPPQAPEPRPALELEPPLHQDQAPPHHKPPLPAQQLTTSALVMLWALVVCSPLPLRCSCREV